MDDNCRLSFQRYVNRSATSDLTKSPFDKSNDCFNKSELPGEIFSTTKQLQHIPLPIN